MASIGGISDITDHAAAAAGLPPVDSLNLWPWLSGAQPHSPRRDVIIGTGDGAVNGIIMDSPNRTAGLWKRLEGTISASGWTAPQSPNASYKTPGASKCEPFCMFRLDEDPGEHHDLAREQGVEGVAAELSARMEAARKTGFAPDRGPQDPQACLTAMEQYGGFWGPWAGT